MPELPELHTITKDLNKYVKNSKIVGIRLLDDKERYGEKSKLDKHVLNHTITDAFRIAKNSVLQLSSDYFLAYHLAMTGQVLLRSPEQKSDNWERITLILKKNNKDFELRFCDKRAFGRLNLLHKNELPEFKQKYGPEPFLDNIDAKRFLSIIQSKNTNIKNALLDQKLISGLGNVYATDALWIAKIHPETKTSQISLKMAEKLLNACDEMLNEGIQNRGISMSDYVDLFGKKGNQQNHFRVYQQEKCKSCDSTVDFMKLNGRGTYFCPNCQTKGSQNNLNLVI